MLSSARAAYDEAVAYIESFITGPAEAPLPRDPAERARLQADRLPRMAALLDALGNPHRQYRVLHVAGTSGKGSTCTIAGAILRAAGLRTGVYTSPYLQTAAEKIAVNGQLIPPADLVALINETRALIESPVAPADLAPVAYAQLWAALAFTYFARRAVDVAVVEVGMGGRYDYTNVLSPAVAAITNVSADHLAALGPTLADIAAHKAGIIKPVAPVITAASGDVLPVIEAEARQQGAPLRRVTEGDTYRVRSMDRDGVVFDYRGARWQLDGLRLRLLGEHQAANASVALGMLEALAEQGVAISEAAVREGLAQAHIPGRLEIVQDDPPVILDGAHNPEKARRLREALATLYPGRDVALVLGCLSAKEVGGIVEELVPIANMTVTTAPTVYFKPAVPPYELAQHIAEAGGRAVAVDGPLYALDMALKAARAAGAVVVVTGSLYLVGEVREHWHPTRELLGL